MNTLMERKADSREELHHQVVAIYEAGKAMVADGKAVKLVLAEQVDDISARQRNFFHGVVLKQISEKVYVGEHKNERFVIKAWKQFFRALFLPDTWESDKVPRWDPERRCLIVPKRPTPRRVRHSTEDLGVKQYSKLIDDVIDHAVVEFGVVFEFDQQEREAVRWKRPARKQQGAEE